MSIPNHILEQLNSQADLISMIGRHTTLKRAGSEFKGCCPFHGEKSPSFYVNPQKNIYHCFGCSVGGNAISFLRDYENLTFMEAVDELSKQTGIEVPKDEQKNVSYQRSKPRPIAQPMPPKVVENTSSPVQQTADTAPDYHNDDAFYASHASSDYFDNYTSDLSAAIDYPDYNPIDDQQPPDWLCLLYTSDAADE